MPNRLYSPNSPSYYQTGVWCVYKRPNGQFRAEDARLREISKRFAAGTPIIDFDPASTGYIFIAMKCVSPANFNSSTNTITYGGYTWSLVLSGPQSTAQRYANEMNKSSESFARQARGDFSVTQTNRFPTAVGPSADAIQAAPFRIGITNAQLRSGFGEYTRSPFAQSDLSIGQEQGATYCPGCRRIHP